MSYPTEEETQYQRRVIRETYPHLFEAVEEQLRYVDEYLPTIPRKQGSKYDLALSAHLARASKTTMGIITLCEYGYGELAMGALRSLGETMVSGYFMSRDQEAHADQFEAFSKLEAIENYKLYERMGWQQEVADVAERFRDPALLKAVKEQFPNPAFGWMQLPMKDVITEIESCWERPEELRQVADMLHLFGDRHSHVGTFDTVALLRAEEAGLVLHLGPGKKWVREALLFTAWVYGQIFDLWAEHFELPDLESWRRRWRLLNARCRTLDPALGTRGVGRNDPCPCGSGFKFKRCHADLI
jgi:hypothetical protein